MWNTGFGALRIREQTGVPSHTRKSFTPMLEETGEVFRPNYLPSGEQDRLEVWERQGSSYGGDSGEVRTGRIGGG